MYLIDRQGLFGRRCKVVVRLSCACVYVYVYVYVCVSPSPSPSPSPSLWLSDQRVSSHSPNLETWPEKTFPNGGEWNWNDSWNGFRSEGDDLIFSGSCQVTRPSLSLSRSLSLSSHRVIRAHAREGEGQTEMLLPG